MEPNLLVLGGTAEASVLCRRLAEAGIQGTVSLAGRVARPVRQPLPQRIGGFGGTKGLVAYLQNNAITHVVDATHPFAAQMSRNAIAACRHTRTPLLSLTRPPWVAAPGDNWICVPDIRGAVAALDRAPQRVMLAVGRMHLSAFAPASHKFFLLRLVDPPEGPLPFPDCQVVVARGPFTLEGDLQLMREHVIQCVVSKNSGGTPAVAKITAARQLGLPVIMIDRPALPSRTEAHDIDVVMDWLAHTSTNLGV